MRFPKIYWLYVFVIAYFLWQGLYPLCLYEHYWPDALIFWADWQTLTAAIIALCASAIVLHTTQHEEEEQRKRSFVASRAFLPHALADLTRYCDECIATYCDYLLTGEGIGILKEVPESAYKTIKECILYATPEVGEYLSKVVGKFQVQNSRFHSHFNKAENSWMRKPDRERAAYHEILATIKIRHIVACLTEFARGESKVFVCKEEPKMDFWFEVYLPESFRNSKGHIESLQQYFDEHRSAFSCVKFR